MWIALSCLSMASGATAAPLPTEVKPLDLYRAKNLETIESARDLALESRGKPWVFSAEEHCNFTFLSPGITDAEYSSAGLQFTAQEPTVVVGWGNYDGLQPPSERILMFPGWNEIELAVSQSAEESIWSLELWADGAMQPPSGYGAERLPHWANPRAEQTLEGTETQTLRFQVYRPGPDGFGLTIRGPEGNHITIKSVRVTQTLNRGFFRKSVTLPPGEIWRAVGELADGSTLYVNGTEVPRALRAGIEVSQGVDLSPFLQAGRENVIALYAEQLPTERQASQVYFQGRVLMADGSVIELDTDSDWLVHSEEQEGWNKPGFDAGDWQAAAAKPPATVLLNRRWPVYDGRLLLENPGPDPKLYFNWANPVHVDVRVPVGMDDSEGGVDWILRRVEHYGERHFEAQGSTSTVRAEPATNSLIYDLPLGHLERGVYTLEVALRSGDDLVDQRFEEPIIVVGEIPMTPVSGDSYEEGMELELEQVIDFTESEGPHRWIEAEAYRGHRRAGTIEAGERITEPRIVEKNRLRYREVTDEAKSAFFDYRFQFQRPHGWYLMVLEYPNDADRAIGFGIKSATRGGTDDAPLRPWMTNRTGGYETQSGPSISTGKKFPVDGKMHEMRWLHWADPEIQIAEIVNRRRGLNAAAARLRIYRVDALPAIDIQTSGERDFGIHTERAQYLGRTFGHSAEMGDAYQIRHDRLEFDMVERFVYRLRWQLIAVENYTEYLRFTGQNSHVMGAFQYSEKNLSYTGPDRVPGDGRLLQDIREVALRVFENNGIDMYSLVEYVNHTSLQTEFAAGQAAVGLGADTISYISRNGEIGDWRGNPNHPAVENGYLTVVDDLAYKFAFSPAWKGIFYKVYVDNGGFGPSPMSLHNRPLDFDYSDATIAVFERDTGISTPGEPDNPKRFELRYHFLTSEEMLPVWIDWRVRNTGDIVRKTLAQLHTHRPDLEVLYSYHDPLAMRYWLMESDLSYADYYRQLAMDPGELKEEPLAWFGRTLYPTGSSRWETGKEHWWEQAVGLDVIDYYNQGPNRLVVLTSGWDEIPTVPPDVPDWPMRYQNSRFIAQAHDDYSLEAFAQAVIGDDPDKLFFGFTDVNIIGSREQQVREVARTITPLPKKKFAPVLGTDDFRHNLAIRALRHEEETWFLVANPGYWPVTAEIQLSGDAKVVRASDGAKADTRSQGGQTVMSLELKPYGMASFKVPGEPVEITGFKVNPLQDEDLAHMRNIMAGAAALLADPGASLAITSEDRAFMRATLEASASLLEKGEYAAAWADLSYWRFWSLRRRMQEAEMFSARLPDVQAPERLDPNELPDLTAVRVSTPPTIDGLLDEEIWQEAPVNTRFISLAVGRDFEGVPHVDTCLQAAYDDEHLYLAVRLADPEVEALRAETDAADPLGMFTKQDDMLAMLLQPAGQRVRQFGVNAGSVSYALLADGGRWPGRADKDELAGEVWRVAVKPGDGYWTVEAAIPFTSLDAMAPSPGEDWKMNVIRRFRHFLVPEIYWSRVHAGWGDTDHYGVLSFQ